MRNPVAGDNRLRQICRAFVRFAEHWFVKNFLRPVFFLMPPSLVTWATMREGVQSEITRLFGSEVAGFLGDSALLVLIGAYLYIVILKSIYGAIENYSKPGRELGRDDVLAILHSVNVVVGDKMKRFCRTLDSIGGREEVSAQDVFQSITQPDQQIGLLVSAVHGAFDFIDNTGAYFRVGLLTVEEGKPIEWAQFYPPERPPRASESDLAHPGSTVMNSIRSKRTVIVEDINKEVKKRKKQDRRYLKLHNRDDEQGSQLCYPVVDPSTREVVLVLTIAGDKQCCLREKHLELYEWIIDHYSVRLTLEHRLYLLREKTL